VKPTRLPSTVRQGAPARRQAAVFVAIPTLRRDRNAASSELQWIDLLSAAFAAAFVAWEPRAKHPMLEMKFFRNRSFSAASASVALVFFALMGTIFFLTQYIQSVIVGLPASPGHGRIRWLSPNSCQR
jgi:hypothetical protein